MAKLQDIISHSCEEKHKRDWGFPVFEGKYFRLLCTFLELWGGGALPSQASQSQHNIQVKFCSFGDLSTQLPSSLRACICRGSQEHQSRNLPSCRRCGQGAERPCRGSCATPSPSNLGLRMSCGASLGKLVFPVCSPVTSHSFLLVSGGFHIGRG